MQVLRTEYARTVEPARALAAEALQLERTFSDLVNQAYGRGTPPVGHRYPHARRPDYLLERRRAGVRNPVYFTVDGGEAIDYLVGNGVYPNRTEHPLPSLVLLELKLPSKSGFEVLEWARQQPEFTSLPIVIYTSSNLGIDREKAHQLGASDYLVKPPNLEQMAELVRDLTRRWLSSTFS